MDPSLVTYERNQGATGRFRDGRGYQRFKEVLPVSAVQSRSWTAKSAGGVEAPILAKAVTSSYLVVRHQETAQVTAATAVG